jgi:hypothetical protein
MTDKPSVSPPHKPFISKLTPEEIERDIVSLSEPVEVDEKDEQAKEE